MLSFLLNLFFPPRCSFCKTEGAFLCERCVGGMNIRRMSSGGPRPASEFKHLDGVIYGADYGKNPALKAAVAQFKYRFTKELTDDFSRLLAQRLTELGMARGKEIALIPVPLHKKRLNYRGFNQAELIAKAVADRVGDRVRVEPLLERVRHTSQQAKLNKGARQENLDGAFALRNKTSPEENTLYFLVDDVCTTGSTLENCAMVLKDAGFPKIYGLVVARAIK